MTFNLVTGYFVQQCDWGVWADVPAHLLEERFGTAHPFYDVNAAQAALDAVEAFGRESDEFRIVGRPVSISQE